MPFAAFFDILGTSRVFDNLADDFSFEGDKWDYGSYAYARKEFHRALEAATEIGRRGFLFRASFSDCAYLIYDDAAGLLLATRIVMKWVYKCAPLRGGIGYGNFGLGSTVHVSNLRGASTEASFFGSALVRAHAAEACSLKGLRVFVHRSAVPYLPVDNEGFVYPELDWSQFEEGNRRETVPATVVRLSGEATEEVTHEICFIGDEDIEGYFRCLEMLERAFPPDERAAVHYERTRETFQRFKALREASLNPTGRSNGSP